MKDWIRRMQLRFGQIMMPPSVRTAVPDIFADMMVIALILESPQGGGCMSDQFVTNITGFQICNLNL